MSYQPPEIDWESKIAMYKEDPDIITFLNQMKVFVGTSPEQREKTFHKTVIALRVLQEISNDPDIDETFKSRIKETLQQIENDFNLQGRH